MKNKLKIFILIIIFIFVCVFLSYNSFVNLKYIRRDLGSYTFMLPKEIEYSKKYINGNRVGILSNKKILNSLLTIYSSNYKLAQSLAKSYVFYDSKLEIIDENETMLDGKPLYSVLKKITYYDNEETTYMFTYVYEIDSKNIFAISLECNNLDDINYYMKKLKKTVKSVILY